MTPDDIAKELTSVQPMNKNLLKPWFNFDCNLDELCDYLDTIRKYSTININSLLTSNQTDPELKKSIIFNYHLEKISGDKMEFINYIHELSYSDFDDELNIFIIKLYKKYWKMSEITMRETVLKDISKHVDIIH